MTSSLLGRFAAQLRRSGKAVKAGTLVFAFNDLPEGRFAAQLRHSADAFKAGTQVLALTCLTLKSKSIKYK